MSLPGVKLGPIFTVLPVPAFVVDLQGRLVEVNDAAVDICGSRSKVELLQKDFLQVLVADEDRAETRVRLKEVQEGNGDGKMLKVTAVTRTGRKQACLKASTIRNEAGKLDGAVIVFQDMGEIKSLAGNASSAGGAEHLSGALSASGLALFCTDKEGKIVEWTPKVEKLTGYVSAQAHGQETSFCIAANFQRSMKKGLDQALRGLDIARFNVSVEHASGKTKDAWLSLAPWRSATGSIVGAVGVLEDAMEVDRRLGEADWIRTAVAEQLDRANATIFSIDPNMCITEWNHCLADKSGKDKESVAGTKLLDLLEPKSRVRAEAAASAAIAGEVSQQPLQMTLLPGLELLVGFSPQFSFTGKVIGALAVGQLLPSGMSARPTSSLEPGTSRKTKGMVLHELRSPLHGILGLANTLSQDAGPLQKPLSMIGLSAERVLNLITTIMDYWNFGDEETRTVVKKDEVVDLSVLANDAATKCESFKDKRGKPLKKDKVEFKKSLQTVVISGDAYSLTQMMVHLLMNAFKFTAEGEVTLTVEKEKETGSAVITVADTGIGIKPESRNCMFDAFRQEDSTESRKYDGIGVGLALVREVVRIHGGSCHILPSDSQGTIVKVTLPCTPPVADLPPEIGRGASADAQGVQQEIVKVPLPGTKPRGPPSSWLGPSAQIGLQINARPSAPVEGGSATASSLPALKEGLPAYNYQDEDEEGQNLIMSVDDDFVNQEVMRSILEPCGFQVIVCMSGAECLEYLEDDNPRPRLLLLDLMMPGLSGFDVLQALQKKFLLGELPVVMVSAKNQSSSVVKGYELGCTDWIHKPFCRQELIARVKSHLKMRDALLSCRRSTAQVLSQDNIVPLNEEDESESVRLPVPKASRPTEVVKGASVKGPVDSTALFASLAAGASEVGDDILAPVFEEFEALSSAHSAVRTEMLGSNYVAIAQWEGDDSRHSDSMFLLAQRMLETVSKAGVPIRIGVHTDMSVPAVIRGREDADRQYPQSSLFSATLQKAMIFCGEAADNRIIMSRSARCRLSADVEAELQKRGLRLLAGDVQGAGEFYFVAAETEATPQPLRQPAEQPKPVQEEGKAKPKEEEPVKELPNQMVLQLQEELQKARHVMQQMQQKLIMADEQMRMSRGESMSLRQQLQQAQQAAQAVQPSPSPIWSSTTDLPSELKRSNSSQASVLFLQWQNAHLQAEIRQYQQALTNTKSELQMQVLAGQLLESKHNLLQARVEHLELDLGFKAICGTLGHTDDMFAELPSLEYKASSTAGSLLPPPSKMPSWPGINSPTSGLGPGLEDISVAGLGGPSQFDVPPRLGFGMAGQTMTQGLSDFAGGACASLGASIPGPMMSMPCAPGSTGRQA